MSEAPWRRPESVLVVVYTASLDILLLQRRRPAGFWQSVTGTLEWGEEPEQAARRELAEETGIEAGTLRDSGVARRFEILPEWRARYAPDVETNLEYLWYLQLQSRVPVSIRADEHAGFEWLSLAEATDKVSSWTNRQALEQLA